MQLFRTIALLAVAGIAVRCAAAAADPAPIRHLEYHITGHTTVNGQSESYDGTASAMGSAGYDGTMSVDVIALAKDGGMVVRASIMVNGEIRPEQAVTCAVYGDERVICPQDAPITGSMHVVFSHLGRDFYDASIVDSNGAWTRNNDGGQVSADSTFESKPTKDANVVAIHEITKVEPRGQIGVGWTDETRLTYDVALSVPLTIHSVSTPDSRSDNGGIEVVDANLLRDSFAKH